MAIPSQLQIASDVVKKVPFTARGQGVPNQVPCFNFITNFLFARDDRNHIFRLLPSAQVPAKHIVGPAVQNPKQIPKFTNVSLNGSCRSEDHMPGMLSRFPHKFEQVIWLILFCRYSLCSAGTMSFIQDQGTKSPFKKRLGLRGIVKDKSS